VSRQSKLIAYLGLVILGALAGAVLILWLSSGTAGGALRATVVERLRGETPEAQVRAYVRAVLRDDEAAALEAWTLQDHELADGRSEALRERREQMTLHLIASRWDEEVRINHIEWWRTCCEPGVTDDPRGAGGARVHVQFLDSEDSPHLFIFDVFHRDGAYWGAAMGYPVRHWALYDVYPYDEEPLFWRFVHEPCVRWLPWPPEDGASAP
jgi:hypothetical protein